MPVSLPSVGICGVSYIYVHYIKGKKVKLVGLPLVICETTGSRRDNDNKYTSCLLGNHALVALGHIRTAERACRSVV